SSSLTVPRPLTSSQSHPHCVARHMKMVSSCAVCALFFACSQAFAGMPVVTRASFVELNPQQFELAVESGYLFGIINPPQDYQVGALVLTGRVRWGRSEGHADDLTSLEEVVWR